MLELVDILTSCTGDRQEVEDKFHFVMKCPVYQNLRNVYLQSNRNGSNIFGNMEFVRDMGSSSH